MSQMKSLPWACVSLSPPTRLSRQDLEAREDAGYASLELPGAAPLSLPALDTDPSDDLISPYASFSSTADRPMPLLSGWLDKLSPQGWGCWDGKGRGAGGWGVEARSPVFPDPRGSPGCSFQHLTDGAPPFPRNYVFQRRFVQFNGRSLMYFGSDKVGPGDAPWGLGRGRGRRAERGSGLEGRSRHGGR